MGKIYELSIDVKISTTSSAVTDMTDVTHIGLDKHLIEQSPVRELCNSIKENNNNTKEIEEDNGINKEITTRKQEEDHAIAAHASQASHPSPIKESHSSSSSLPSSDKDQQSSISLTITPSIDEVSSMPSSSSLLQEQENQFNTEIGEEKDMSDIIYRLGRSDKWACNDYKDKGDKWYMLKHLCRKNKK